MSNKRQNGVSGLPLNNNKAENRDIDSEKVHRISLNLRELIKVHGALIDKLEKACK